MYAHARGRGRGGAPYRVQWAPRPPQTILQNLGFPLVHIVVIVADTVVVVTQDSNPTEINKGELAEPVHLSNSAYANR